MENLGYLLQDDDIPQAVKRRSVKEKSKSVQLENVSKKYLFAKRAIDVILSFCAVAVLSVPMLLIALVVFFAGLPQSDLQTGSCHKGRTVLHHV